MVVVHVRNSAKVTKEMDQKGVTYYSVTLNAPLNQVETDRGGDFDDVAARIGHSILTNEEVMLHLAELISEVS